MREETRQKELAALQREHASSIDSANGTGDPKIQLPRKIFSFLSPTERTLWDQFPQSTKEIILTSRKPAAINDHGYDNLSEPEAATLRQNYQPLYDETTVSDPPGHRR